MAGFIREYALQCILSMEIQHQDMAVKSAEKPSRSPGIAADWESVLI